MRHDYAVQIRQAALFGFQLQQIGEGGCADGDRRDAEFFKEDGGVDTPRRAGASITRADQQEVGPVAQRLDGRVRGRPGDGLAADG